MEVRGGTLSHHQLSMSFSESDLAAQMKISVSKSPTSQICFHSKYFSNRKNNNHKESRCLGGKLEASLALAINVGYFLFPYKHENGTRSHQGRSISLQQLEPGVGLLTC